jgi:predicted RNA binding protein YcfA (HicA-like mRNA interferase family)
MKRLDLIRAIERLGCEFVRHGGKHDWYRNPTTGVAQAIPRHREINEGLARRILRMLSNPPAAPPHGPGNEPAGPPAGTDESATQGLI